MASSVASGESFSSVSASDTLDDSELSAPNNATKPRSSSLSALGVSFDLLLSSRYVEAYISLLLKAEPKRLDGKRVLRGR